MAARRMEVGSTFIYDATASEIWSYTGYLDPNTAWILTSAFIPNYTPNGAYTIKRIMDDGLPRVWRHGVGVVISISPMLAIVRNGEGYHLLRGRVPQ